MVKRFIIDLLIFLCPIALIVALPFFVLFKSGEYTDLNSVIEKQSIGDKKYLVGFAYVYPIRYYKFQMFLKTDPQVIALGSSRSFEFRGSFFKNATFYDAGGAVQHLNSLERFIDLVPKGSKLKLVVLVMDHNWLNPNRFDNRAEERESLFDKYYYPIGSLIPNSWDVYKDIMAHKISVGKLMETSSDTGYNLIGLTAIMNNAGFRNEGSYHYNKDKVRYEPFSLRFQIMVDYAKSHQELFVNGDSAVYNSSMQQLSRILGKFKAKGIYVAAYLPPIADCIMKVVEKDTIHLAYMHHLKEHLKPIFDAYNFSIQDYTRLKSLNGNDSEMIDGVHGSEKLCLSAWIDMVKHDPNLQKYADLPYLEKSLATKRTGYYEVFGY